jgi:low affinity Fe/Cu permease
MRVRSYFTKLGEASAHPAAFVIVGIYAVSWFFLERETFDWHGVATLCTWAMTLFIQRSESRDTMALHAKLDELLRATKHARNDLTFIDDKDLEEVREHRDEERVEPRS